MISDLTAILVKVVLIVLFLFIVFVVIKGLNQTGYSVQAFQVPQTFEEAGYNGQVIALMLQDEITDLKSIANSQREDSLEVNVDLRPDLSLDLMGVGLSSSSIIYHLRELLGRKNKTISGNLTDLEGEIAIQIRMTDFNPFEYAYSYEDSEKGEAIKHVIEKGAMYMLENFDPYRLAVVHDKQGRTDMAEELLRKIIKERRSDRKWAYHFWGNIKNRKGDAEASARYYQKALEADPEFVLPMRVLAWKFYRERDYVQALSYFEKVLEIDPTQYSMDTGAALCYRFLGNADKAEDYYKDLVNKFPKIIWGYGNYSDFLLKVRKDTAAATELWQKASENLDESADYYLALAAFHTMKQDSVKAIELAHQALDLEPDNVGTLFRLSNHYINLRTEPDKTLKLTQTLVKETEEHNFDSGMKCRAYNLLAIAEYELANYDSALVHVQRSIALSPENPFPYSTLAEIHLLKGDMALFYGAIQKAISFGFPMERFFDVYPYNRIKDRSRLLQIMDESGGLVSLKG